MVTPGNTGSLYIHTDTVKADMKKAMKNAAWVVRHSLQRNHPYDPYGCAGCKLIEDFLKENPENQS